MTFASIHDIAASWDVYERSLAHVITPLPDGLILHLAGPTDEGVRIVAVWVSEHAFERFRRDRLGPAIAATPAPVSLIWTVRGLRIAHAVRGRSVINTNPSKEQPSC